MPKSTPIINGRKLCPKCGENKPATTEYFYVKNGLLTSPCRECTRATVRIYREKNPEKCRETLRRSHQKFRSVRIPKMRDYYDKNVEYLREWARNYYREHKDERNIYSRNYHKIHKEGVREWMRIYIPLYRLTPKGRAVQKAASHNYNARKRSLPTTFTSDDWLKALNYWHGRCAVCGRQLGDLFGTQTGAADHWIPLNSPDCPGTIPENMLPLCHGLDGCNNSKADRNPEEWLVERFGKRKARKILKDIHTYFEWVKLQK